MANMQGRRVGWHTGAAVPPNQKKKRRKFSSFHFFCFLSLNLTVNFVVFHVLSSIFKYSVNFIGAAGLKLGMLHYKFLQGFLYKA